LNYYRYYLRIETKSGRNPVFEAVLPLTFPNYIVWRGCADRTITLGKTTITCICSSKTEWVLQGLQMVPEISGLTLELDIIDA
jgi:hypothetical protein